MTDVVIRISVGDGQGGVTVGGGEMAGGLGNDSTPPTMQPDEAAVGEADLDDGPPPVAIAELSEDMGDRDGGGDDDQAPPDEFVQGEEGSTESAADEDAAPDLEPSAE